MRVLAVSLSVGLGLMIGGCGGSGGSSTGSGQTTGQTQTFKSVTPLSLPAGATVDISHVTINGVDDSGVAYGSAGLGAYWTSPSQGVTIPMIDSTASQEYLVGRSSDGTQYIGYTWDGTANPTTGPSRGFVYSPSTGQYHVLQIPLPTGATQIVVKPQTISGATVTGVYYTYPAGQPGTGHTFTYNLSNDQYTSGTITLPTSIGSFTVSVGSQNGLYLGGQDSVTGLAEVFKSSGTTPYATDSTDSHSAALYVSNDGSVAAVNSVQTGGSSGTVQDVHLWLLPGSTTTSLLPFLQGSGQTVTSDSLSVGSPAGHYLIIESQTASGVLPILLNVK